jgi:Glycosyl hydrolases family 2, TIM barrel domain/Glycosyl hydrolases family 2, sugar binding domain
MTPIEPATGTELHGYPRPLLQRAEWFCLNGLWDFAIDAEARWTAPEQVLWESKILVPFSPETPASGIDNTGYYRACWYRTTFQAPEKEGKRLMLHFGAVDYSATVWVNGSVAGTHEGGYTPFCIDITDLVFGPGVQTIVVRAEDDPADLAKPRGKQDWQPEAHGIWYPRTTGIWQTAWMERLPRTAIGFTRLTPSLERWEIGLEVRTDGEQMDGLRLHVTMRTGDRLLAEDVYAVIAGEVNRGVALSDPGIDDSRNELLWTPETPTLIEVQLRLENRNGEMIDEAHSYTALRSISIQGDRFVLNGRPYYLRMVLDQGYWPESGLTAPEEAALRRDVELAKAMGFNGVRKHQKIEAPRYLYWADVLGLVVWEEMPSAYRYNKRSIQRLTREWMKVIERDVSHPCIVAWVPFNESWGVPDLPDSSAQRHYVRALYHMTKSLDPTRPVIGNDGWESVATDIIGVHDYDDDPERIGRRYGTEESLPRLLKRERPGGRILVLEDSGQGQPLMVTEFGGIAFSAQQDGTWGYTRSDTAEELGARVMDLLSVVRSLPALTGFCYTQFTDTYQEVNGLLFANRTPKIPVGDLRIAVLGPNTEQDRNVEWMWRERLMEHQRRQVPLPQPDYSR